MADHTDIEWTDRTWNPVTGCTKVSAGCDHCYAETIAERFRGGPAFPNGFDIQLREHKLTEPLRWRKPSKVFVNSMSDLFHDTVPDEYIARVWAVMALAPRHTFQVLTKRHGRMRSLLNDHEFGNWMDHEIAELGGGVSAFNYRWPLSNVWLGVSTENQRWADIRIPALLDTPAAVRWISAEPLLGPINLGDFVSEASARRHGVHDSICDGMNGGCFTPWCKCSCHRRKYNILDWVVVGGESGPKARPMDPQWARDIRDQCVQAAIPFHFKQFGEWAPRASSMGGHTMLTDGYEQIERVGKKRACRVLDGRTWDEYPGGEV